ncbi:MAG: hypothetical protein ABL994_23670, partial [Verrucomicrobiales bacterium]
IANRIAYCERRSPGYWNNFKGLGTTWQTVEPRIQARKDQSGRYYFRVKSDYQIYPAPSFTVARMMRTMLADWMTAETMREAVMVLYNTEGEQ